MVSLKRQGSNLTTSHLHGVSRPPPTYFWDQPPIFHHM